MALFKHFEYNNILLNNILLNEGQCNSIEQTFQTFLNASPPDTNALTLALEPFFSDKMLFSSGTEPYFAPTTLKDYPTDQIILTQIVEYCIEQYGFDEDNKDINFKKNIETLLAIPVIKRLVQQKNGYLLSVMNRKLEIRKEKIELLEKCKKLVLSLDTLDKSKHDECAEKLSDFLYRMKHPEEDEDKMQKSFDDFLQYMSKVQPDSEWKKKKTEKEIIAWLYAGDNAPIGPEMRFVFLSSVHRRYTEKKFTSLMLESLGRPNSETSISTLPDAIRAIEVTHEKMNFKTRWQACGMMLGGVTFGIECVMLILEKGTVQGLLDNPIEVISYIALGLLVFGYPMGKFFYSAHVKELDKQNKEHYFEKHFNLPPAQEEITENRGIKFNFVLFGVLAEAVLVFRGIISGFAFVLDMAIWSDQGGEYDNNIPGAYFWEESPSGLLSCVLAVSIVTFAAWVAYSLASGHYALDGKESNEHETAQEKDKRMRTEIKLNNAVLRFSPESRLTASLPMLRRCAAFG